METSASFEARSAPSSYPTASQAGSPGDAPDISRIHAAHVAPSSFTKIAAANPSKFPV